MRNGIIALTCFIALLLCPALAPAQMMGPGGMGSGGGMGYGDAHAYGGWGSGGGKNYEGWGGYQLTPEQQKAYEAIVEKYSPVFNTLAESMWAKRAQLNAVLAQDKIDRKQAKALAGELGKLSAQAYEQRVDMLVDMREQGISYYGMDMMGGGMMGGPWHHGYRHGPGSDGDQQ